MNVFGKERGGSLVTAKTDVVRERGMMSLAADDYRYFAIRDSRVFELGYWMLRRRL
jgi:hypothetical protein